jgi:lipopolysaccharide transport system ATP-binding protein
VRLAFAVAAHLEPEILIVDEVLAVGDAQFQQKCLGKMQNVALNEGRTVLFVSHNMGAIRDLCSTVELLENGRIEMRGAPGEVIAHFLRSGASRAEIRWANGNMPGDETIKLHMVRITDTEGRSIHTVDARSGFVVEMEYEIFRKVRGLEIGFRLSAVDGTPILTTDDTPSDCAGSVRLPGRYLARCQMPAGLLSSQTYCFSFGAHEPNVRLHYLVEAALELGVSQTLTGGGNDPRWGVICPALPWSVSKMK